MMTNRIKDQLQKKREKQNWFVKAPSNLNQILIGGYSQYINDEINRKLPQNVFNLNSKEEVIKLSGTILISSSPTSTEPLNDQILVKEMQSLLDNGTIFSFLDEEEDLYNEDDLIERYDD